MRNEKTRILAHPASFGEGGPRRARVAFGIAGLSFLSMVAFAVAPHATDLQVSRRELVEAVALPSALPTQPPMTFAREEQVQRGETLANLLRRMGVDDPEALDFLRRSPTSAALLRELRPGRALTLTTDERGRLTSLAFPLSGAGDQALFVERSADSLAARTVAVKTETRVALKSAEIKSSLFAAADDVGLPESVAVQLTEIFGAQIDFHRDLRRGDRFSVAYEMAYHQGRLLRTGRLLAAQLVIGGQTHSAFHFGGSKGEYYDRGGKSLKKAFLRSPLEFSRISSEYTESRYHPILRDWRAHKGVDYAAPVGTGVKATADGVVEFVGRQNGYGNLIILRHHDRYTTHYGHLHGFAAGILPGARVEQGQLIGYVGQTGRATGPHLHYEFRADAVHQDPLGAALPIAIPLDARQLADFKFKTEPLVNQLAMIRPSDAMLE